MILTKGEAQSIIFNETAIVGQLSGTFDDINITIPGELLNIHLTAQYNDLYVTISSKAIGTYTYYLVNVSGTVTYTGQFVGTVNGKQVSEGSGTISGMINGTIKGVIKSATLYAGYTQGFLGYNYLYGYIAVVGQVPMTVTFSGTQNLFGYYVAVPIINGEVVNPSFDNTQAYPAISTYSLVPFNITLNNFNGELTLTDQYAQGVFKGNITFPQPNPLSLLPPDAGTFDGYLNGIFGGNYNYMLGQLGLLAGQPVILSVKSSNATIYPGGYIFGTGYVEVLTPLIVKVNLAIYNPTNNTLEIDKI